MHAFTNSSKVIISYFLSPQPLLFTSSLISGASMCVLASWFVLRARGVPAPGWLPVSALCLCIFCDAAGLQPISMVVMNEIFSFKVSLLSLVCFLNRNTC